MEHFGTTPDGTVVHAITIASERLSVTILTLGARTNHVSLDGSPNLTLGSASVDEALGNKLHAGPIIAPVINRLAGAAVGGGILAHSGTGGSQRQVWGVAEQSDTSVTLTLALPDGAGGFPGNRTLTARYVVQEHTLSLDLQATTDRPTLMNPGHHGYWNLDGTEDWTGHTLRVAASEYLPVTDQTLPTGEVASVEGTPFDLRENTEPKVRIDNNYCLPDHNTPAFAARLQGTSGRAMELLTDAPGLQVFTGKPAAIALEPQLWPDAPNHKGFPSIRLEPGETFTQSTLYVFSGP